MFKRRFSLLIALTLLWIGSGLAEAYGAIYSSDNPIPDIAERISPAIVQVVGSVESWDANARYASVQEKSAGSGSYIRADENGGGYILTNYHIISDADVYSIRWMSGEEMDATLVGYDYGTDIAILHFKEPAPEGVELVPLGDSDALRVGELAICIGNPGYQSSILYCSVTAGIISGLGRDDINASNFGRNVSVIQTDAPINVGNSGGALLNSKGELVGIPTLKFMFTPTTVYEGLGFCVPINAIRDFIDQIIDTGVVIRPRLGITISDIDGPDEPMHKYPPIGAQVFSVDESGPAKDSGIQVGDVITEVNGVRVKGYMAVLKELDKCAAGDKVTLKVCRYYDKDGNLTGTYEEMEFTIVLEMLE